MKNFIMTTAAFLLLMVFVPNTSQAQKVGIRAGLNVSNIDFENLPDKKERFGYHVGVFGDFPVIVDFLSLQPELSYSVKGTAFKFLNERQTLNLNYVDFLLPVAFKLGAIDLQVGPFVSYLVSDADYTVYNDNTVVVDAFKKGDVGLTAGLSFNFDRAFLGIRYNQGLMDITKDNARTLLGSGKNAVGQVSLGFRF